MEAVLTDSDHVNLLWTGGWDSTFQLLRLLLIQKRSVSPFYLIDAKRASTGEEILAMSRIKNMLLQNYPHTKQLLCPTLFYAVEDISEDADITGAYKSIRQKKHIGSQYDWLARFCKEKSLFDIQLCVESYNNPDKKHFNIDDVLTEQHDGYQDIYYIDERFRDTEEGEVFSRFSFPIINLTKSEMLKNTNENMWGDIMNLTWFCHSPSNKKPCGKCNPCVLAYREGFGSRIPFRNRFKAYFRSR
ncbi:7-cyano-7-deazaguanine synthase [BD1-7 clade bacterium]|nr:7-cyano-7-deazaguanine synthase [BD1-7 clade bacterium]